MSERVERETVFWGSAEFDTPSNLLPYADALLAESRRRARAFARGANGPLQGYIGLSQGDAGWKLNVSHMICDAADNDFGTFIAGLAVLSGEDVDGCLTALPDEGRVSAEAEKFRALSRSRLARWRVTTVACGVVSFVASGLMILSFVGGSSAWFAYAPVIMLVPIEMQIVSILLTCFTATVFFGGTLLLHTPQRFRALSLVVSCIFGLAFGLVSCGLPPLVALFSWLAWTKIITIAPSIQEAERFLPQVRRRASSMVHRGRITLSALRTPRYVRNARELADGYDGDVRWMLEVKRIVEQASDDDLGTYIAAEVLLELGIMDEEMASEDDSESDVEARGANDDHHEGGQENRDSDRLFNSGLVGMLAGVSIGIVTSFCLSSAEIVSVGSSLWAGLLLGTILLGALLGWRLGCARAASDIEANRFAYSWVLASVVWKLFWVAYLIVVLATIVLKLAS